MHWRYQLLEEVQLRTVRIERGKIDRISINIFELVAMVIAAYVMIAMRGDKPDGEEATVLIRGDH